MTHRDRRAALLGAILVAPAVAFVIGNVVVSALGLGGSLERAVTPEGAAEALSVAVVLGGPIGALVLTLKRIAHVGFRRRPGEVAVSIGLRSTRSDLAVAVAAAVTLAVIGTYVVSENVACWFGAAATC